MFRSLFFFWFVVALGLIADAQAEQPVKGFVLLKRGHDVVAVTMLAVELPQPFAARAQIARVFF